MGRNINRPEFGSRSGSSDSRNSRINNERTCTLTVFLDQRQRSSDPPNPTTFISQNYIYTTVARETILFVLSLSNAI